MPRRAQGLWKEVVDFHALMAAARRASRGKRSQAAVMAFMLDVEHEVLALKEELSSDTWRPGPWRTFEIKEPKSRIITVAPFRDRVVHQSLIAALEPTLERRMIFESFACRRGKGTHRALDHAQGELRRYSWFLKLDVKAFFASLNHDVVYRTLARAVKDHRVLDLCRRVLGQDPVCRRGLPVGSLTSQWFANATLDRLDHFVKERLRVPGYVRYMDDFVLFGDQREALRVAWRAVETYLESELLLSLNPRATQLSPYHQGLPFLGWRLYRGMRRLRPMNLARTAAKLRRRRWQWERGQLGDEALASAVRSVCEHLTQGSTRALRRRLFSGELRDLEFSTRTLAEHPGSRGPPPGT